MFDLEQAIANWRRELCHAGIRRPEVSDELESHLREDMANQIQSGTNEQAAFEAAVRCIGQSKLIKREFKKIEAKDWNRPLAWSAWGLFVISFFLPVMTNFYFQGRGWQYALATFTEWRYVINPHDWSEIHMALLSFANLFMIASPFLISRCSRNKRHLNWLRISSFAACTLVGSFILFIKLFSFNDWEDKRIGCYLWAASFLLLYLSSFSWRKRKEQYV